MMNILISLLLVVFALGCTQAPERSDQHEMKRRQVDEYFISSGVVRYFLPEVPYWANFSEAGNCRRDGVMRFFELKKVRSSLSLDYEQAIQLQLMFNNSLKKLKREKKVAHIPFKDEEALFFKSSEKIQAGIRVFKIPKYKKINLLWIDPLINEGRVKELKKIINTEAFVSGHPVFVTLCKSRQSLERWMSEKGLADRNIRLLTYELLSPFNLRGELGTRYHIYLDELFENKEVVLFSPRKKRVPEVFEGKYKNKFY